jgi:hypothetical protein
MSGNQLIYMVDLAKRYISKYNFLTCLPMGQGVSIRILLFG